MATVGRVAEVSQCIDSLTHQTRRNFELIVVDQNPDDRLVPILEAAKRSGISLLHLRQKALNQCEARNTGVAHARFEIVAFPDDDCWYEVDVVERVLDRMVKHDRPDGMLIRWVEADPVGREGHTLSVEKMRRFREVDTSMIVMFFRLNLFSALGNFDVRFGLHSWFGGSEEIDLMLRFLSGDRHVVYAPDIIVHHPLKSSPVSAAREQFRRFRSRSRGMGGVYAKHNLGLYVVARGFLVPWLRAAYFLFSPPLAAMHAGIALGRLEGYLRWKFMGKKQNGSC